MLTETDNRNAIPMDDYTTSVVASLDQAHPGFAALFAEAQTSIARTMPSRHSTKRQEAMAPILAVLKDVASSGANNRLDVKHIANYLRDHDVTLPVGLRSMPLPIPIPTHSQGVLAEAAGDDVLRAALRLHGQEIGTTELWESAIDAIATLSRLKRDVSNSVRIAQGEVKALTTATERRDAACGELIMAMQFGGAFTSPDPAIQDAVNTMRSYFVAEKVRGADKIGTDGIEKKTSWLGKS